MRLSKNKLPQRGRTPQHEEYGREQKGVTACPKCKNVHFKKRWFASEKDLNGKITHTKICPACRMKEDHTFEGEVFIEGFPPHQTTEMLNLVQNFGDYITEVNPQHRILAVEKTKNGYRVTLTENLLADKLAKKIRDTFNTVDMHMSHAPEPAEVDRVHVVFQGSERSP